MSRAAGSYLRGRTVVCNGRAYKTDAGIARLMKAYHCDGWFLDDWAGLKQPLLVFLKGYEIDVSIPVEVQP